MRLEDYDMYSPRFRHRVAPWCPVIAYAATTIGFLIAVAFFRPELFAGLDQLAHWLRSDAQLGRAVLFALIFITTIPPFPLYSTFIALAGYTFGPWQGAFISYFAALSGALAVFVVSREYFRESIVRWLSLTRSIKRVVRAVERRPTLLFLIRLAPYPFNVMNCLLAAAPSLTLRTYTVCTALSLIKVIVHTTIGASVHSFRDYHSNPSSGSDQAHSSFSLTELWTIFGIALCVALLVYLSIVARRAVDDELDDEEDPYSHARDAEERLGFLSPAAMASSSELQDPQAHMEESPFRSALPLTVL